MIPIVLIDPKSIIRHGDLVFSADLTAEQLLLAIRPGSILMHDQTNVLHGFGNKFICVALGWSKSRLESIDHGPAAIIRYGSFIRNDGTAEPEAFKSLGLLIRVITDGNPSNLKVPVVEVMKNYIERPIQRDQVAGTLSINEIESIISKSICRRVKDLPNYYHAHTSQYAVMSAAISPIASLPSPLP